LELDNMWVWPFWSVIVSHLTAFRRLSKALENGIVSMGEELSLMSITVSEVNDGRKRKTFTFIR
jgi:hypothetical protein